MSGNAATSDPLDWHGDRALVDLPPGSFVIEKYLYATNKQTTGVQWLAEVVGEDGNLWHMGAFRTRREALDCIHEHGTAAARNAHD